MATLTDDGPETVTEAEFTAAMEAAAAERGPDFVYPKGADGWVQDNPDGADWCVYVRTDVDEPACIIGTALHRLGFPLSRLRCHEGDGSDDILEKLLPDLDEAAVSAAAAAQSAQDRGCTWEYALAAYKEELVMVARFDR